MEGYYIFNSDEKIVTWKKSANGLIDLLGQQ